MDNGEGAPAGLLEENAEQPSNINFSDVFEAILVAEGRDAGGGSTSAGGGGAGGGEGAAAGGLDDDMYRPAQEQRPYCRILEQPASKALRFRYECEGRSAGSIPGANSTPEKKTFPSIEIVGHKGRAIVVVSCVTKEHKDQYRPHPHNLVGRELCKKGVCTVNVGADSGGIVTFSNLGIQCVKRRDIEDALRLREEMRVDPFKTGFSHKNQPQSIDLNAVRLCFQVFLPDERTGKIRHALPPVVSDVIYDKKAMSDLVISRLSHCSAPVTGGTKIILLCEKVAREDIAVTFYESNPGGAVVWRADAGEMYVHKQVAICVSTPRYREPAVTRHVQAFIQLRRLSDNQTSEPVAFELLPATAGTFRKPPPTLAALLSHPRTITDTNNNKDNEVTSTSEESANASEESGSANIADSNIEMIDSVTSDGNDRETLAADDHDKSLNELLDQVAELDEIYSENKTRLQNFTVLNDTVVLDEDFNDAGTYTSLQLAFKNPVSISEPEPTPFGYEDVHTFRGPIIEYSALKRDTDDERAPPLPPKRVRKTPSIEQFKTSQTSVESLLKPGRQIPLSRTQNASQRSDLSTARSEPALPPSKKRSFFSRLFRRREKSPAPSIKSEGKKEREKNSKPVGRSVSSVSGIRPSKFKSSISHTSLKDNASGTGLSYADSITHISLHGDENDKTTSQTSLRKPGITVLPPTDGGTILVAESVLALDASQFKKLQDDLDLTDAEHYALYMAVAPHATVSEFDETSCYYQPVDGNSDYLRRKRQKTFDISPAYSQQGDQDMNPHMPEYYELIAMQRDQRPIKLEPRERQASLASPPLSVYSPQHEPQDQHYQQWAMQDNMQGGLTVPGPGPSHLSPYQGGDMTWGQTMSPLAPAVSPNMAHAPHMSPNMGHRSPNMGHGSPNMGHVSPNMGHVSPNMGHVSPNMAQMQTTMIQQQTITQLQQTTMECTTSSDPPSITGLLLGECMPQLNSSELSGLSSLLADADRPTDSLSETLNRLSTADLMPMQ